MRRILQRADVVPDDLVELIVGRCDGNPFFVEELLKMLVDDRVIRTDGPDGRWSIDGDRLALSRVPATLTGVLQARLDNLAPQELTVLQCASIVGRVFWDASVAALHEGASTEQVRVSLDASRARELVFRRDQSVFAGCDELIFKHALLRDVTYETVLLRDRRRLHGRAAAWLTSTAGDRLGEYLDTVAHHHRLAGEPAAAAVHFHQAARAALQRGLASSARRSAEQAVEQWALAGAGGPVRRAAHPRRVPSTPRRLRRRRRGARGRVGRRRHSRRASRDPLPGQPGGRRPGRSGPRASPARRGG